MREPERLSERKLLAAVSDFQPEFILVIQGTRLSPKTVNRLRTVTKAPIACWYQDAVSSLGRQFMLGAEYDAVFVKDRYMQSLFSRMIRSTTFYYLPEACNPRVHRSVNLTVQDIESYGCDIMIAGTHYYYRQEILRQLSGIRLRFYSGTRAKWLLDRLPKDVHQGRPVVLEEKAKALRAARICLNTLHFAEINGLNCRAFEIAGCGGFQLVSAVPALAEHFEPGKELATFDSIDELVERIDYYLRNPQLMMDIALRGQQRAHKDHTYEHRLTEILGTCTGFQWQRQA
jgi:spore maturation protein CgeB